MLASSRKYDTITACCLGQMTKYHGMHDKAITAIPEQAQ
jgi:hypothetical protein